MIGVLIGLWWLTYYIVNLIKNIKTKNIVIGILCGLSWLLYIIASQLNEGNIGVVLILGLWWLIFLIANRARNKREKLLNAYRQSNK